MPERGFTLLEIMLVIFLIGLASSGVVQTFATDSEPPAKKAAQDPISLETPIGEKEDSHLGDFIEDQKTASPEDEAAATMRREQIHQLLETLTEREKGVIALRYGIDDGTQRTLEEVGKYFDVTRERIRQIEGKALTKLKKSAKSLANV